MSRDEEKAGRIEKAGIIAYGMAKVKTPAGSGERLHVLASYTEGRFGERDKCYNMPKGDLNKNERPLQGAVREFKEETGFDLEDFLGENYSQFLAGSVIRNMTNAKYPGVKIVLADPQQPIDDHYISARGNTHRIQYFPIEIEGIEHLRPHLKSIPGINDHTAAQVNITAKEMTDRLIGENKLPSFRQRLDILRTGVATSRATAECPASSVRILREPTFFAHYEKKWLEAQGQTGHITSRQDWEAFFKHPPEAEPYDQSAEGKRLKHCGKLITGELEKMKKYFAEMGIASDTLPRKLSAKEHSLEFYHEMAEVLPVGVMLERMVDCANRNEHYARAMFGESMQESGQLSSEEQMMQYAQVTPVAKFLASHAPMEVVAAAIDIPNTDGRGGWEKKRNPPSQCSRSSAGPGLHETFGGAIGRVGLADAYADTGCSGDHFTIAGVSNRDSLRHFPLRHQSELFDQRFCDLHRVQRGAFTQIIGGDPEVDTVL